MKKYFEIHFFYKHGAPKRFRADQEFFRPILTRFLRLHNILINPRSSQTSHMTGIIELNNGVFKTVMSKFQMADTNAKPETLVARASFMTNLIRGSKYMSAYQMARGHTPSIFGIPRQMISQYVINAHIERESTRSIERLIKSKVSKTVNTAILTPGMKILVYYKRSKQNEVNEWIESTIQELNYHVISAKRNPKDQQ